MAGIASPSLPLRSQTTFRRCVFHLSRFPDVFGEQILSGGLFTTPGCCVYHFTCCSFNLYTQPRSHMQHRECYCIFFKRYFGYFSRHFTVKFVGRKLPRHITQSASGAPAVRFCKYLRQYQLTFVLPLKRPLSAKCRSHSLFGVALL